MPKIVLFCHSLRSDWNHGNAHFLRGVLSECWHAVIDVSVFEPATAGAPKTWSGITGRPRSKLCASVPAAASGVYDSARLDLDRVLDGADLVLVHEWNEPELVARIGAHRKSQRLAFACCSTIRIIAR